MPRRLAALGLLLLAACAGADVRGDLVAGIRRRLLPNGLAVVAVEDPRLPRVTAMLAYRVGSVDEPPGMTGASHFFEHMVFKGTRKYPPGSIDRITQRCGGENNAFTTHDMTGYWFHVHVSHLDEVLDILADTMGNCTLDPGEFERERGPVLQEMAIWMDSGWGPVERELGKTVHGSGSYRHPVLGWKEDVEKMTRDRMVDYYRTHYHPNNATLVIVGQLPAGEMFRKVEEKFSSIPPGPAAREPAWRAPTQEAERKVEVPTPQPTDRFILAFRAAPAGSDEDLALDLLATVLGEGRASRLKSRLADELDLAGQDTIQVTNESRRREGIFEVRVELALDADLEEARRVVVEELDRLRDEPVGDRELRRAKNILRARFAFDSESQYELASKIGYFEALGRPDYVSTYMDRIEAMDAAQLQAVARRILRPEGRTWALGRAKGAPAPKRGKPWQGLRPRQAAYEAPVLGDVRERVLPNGVTLIALRRPGTRVLSLQAYVAAGLAYEPPGQGGVARLTGELLAEGIEDDRGRRRGGEDLASELEFVGGEFLTGPAGLAVKVLSDHREVALDLVRDLLRFPSFPRARFDALKEDLLADIESQDGDPDRVARRLFFAEAFRGHPFERPSTGSKESVEALELRHVREYHRRHFRPERTIVAAVGDLEPDAILSDLEARLGNWSGAGPSKVPEVPAAVRGASGRTIHHAYASQQVRIRIGHVGVTRTTPDWAALRVMETILCSSSGFTNRLAQVVREQEGLAYDVGGSITTGAGPVAGPFEISLGVDPRQKDRAVALVKGELKRFLEEGPTEEEVADAKRYLLASQASAWETADAVGAWLLEARRHGLGYDAAARFHREVSAVGREEVVRTARKHIDLGALVTVVVGPVDKDGKLLEGVQDR